jgi:hypothetical protein
MSDFTIHKDPERKGRYLDRHKNDGKTIDTNGFWATNLLWNKPSLLASAKDIQARKKIKVVLKV